MKKPSKDEAAVNWIDVKCVGCGVYQVISKLAALKKD